MGEGLFTSDLFRFLEDLRKHNDRAWFAKNKERYLDAVQEPALEFVGASAPTWRSSARTSSPTIDPWAVRCSASIATSGSPRTRPPTRPTWASTSATTPAATS